MGYSTIVEISHMNTKYPLNMQAEVVENPGAEMLWSLELCMIRSKNGVSGDDGLLHTFCAMIFILILGCFSSHIASDMCKCFLFFWWF